MKILIRTASSLAALSSLVAVMSVHATDAWEGSFSNGTVTITRSVGNRGGDEFISTKCKGKVFKPMLDAKSDSVFGENKAYVITPDSKYSLLDVKGSNPCMPSGRYLRVN